MSQSHTRGDGQVSTHRIVLMEGGLDLLLGLSGLSEKSLLIVNYKNQIVAQCLNREQEEEGVEEG